MGLHICYELALPSETDRARVLEQLGALHHHATRLGFEWVTEIREFHGAECEYLPGEERWSARWVLFKIAAGKPAYAAGFVVWPGRRSESAAFGFSQESLQVPVGEPGWHWHYCCKTQYASIVSEEHFLRCHLGLIELLDSAAGLGIQTTVRDEAGYFEHRDVRRLLETVHAWNKLIARIAGRLAGELDSEDTRTQSPIFQHPRFEHLEGEG